MHSQFDSRKWKDKAEVAGRRCRRPVCERAHRQADNIEKKTNLEHENWLLQVSSSMEAGDMHAIGTRLPGFRAPLRREKPTNLQVTP
jgi:hypothetical protein